MLQFFRKYQKIFFVLVTAMIVVSFTFFGTYSTLASTEELPRVEVGKTQVGESIYDGDVRAISALLSLSSNKEGASLFDEWVVEGGLGDLILKTHFDLLKEELQAKYQKIRSFTPYVHPQADFLSARTVWERFAPEIAVLLTKIQEGPEQVTLDQAHLLFQLYAAQNQFPASFLKQVLYFQQAQYDWIQQDPAILSSDHTIAGLTTPEEWFGPKCLEKVSIALLNAAHHSMEKGVLISRKEAEHQLKTLVARQLQTYKRDATLSSKEVELAVMHLARAAGVEEARAADLWRKLATFQKDWQETAASVIVDRLPFDQRAEKAREKIRVRLYQLPKLLQFQNVRTLLKFERYLEAVAPGAILELPSQLLAAEEVEKRFPQLVENRAEIEVASASLSEIADTVSLKQTWDWELLENNFAALAKEFPVLGSKPSDSKEARFAALQSLDQQTRFKLDKLARLQIAQSHPEWVSETLQKRDRKTVTLSIRQKGGSIPFEGMKEGQLASFLSAPPAQEPFSFDQEHFYTVRLLGLDAQKRVIAFEEALADGTLDRLLDSLLESAYPSMSRRPELKGSDGSVRPLEEIKDQLGALLYKDRLDAVRKSVGNAKLSLDELAAHRFDAYLRNVKEKLSTGGELPLSQWPFEISEQNWVRGEARFLCAEPLEVGQWGVTADGGVFQVLDRAPGRASDEEIAEAQRVLAEEARSYLFQESIL